MGRLEGKVAIVTGSSRGIGAGVAQRLAAEGAGVVVNYLHNEEAALKVVDSITAKGGKAVACRADVADEEQMEALFQKARLAFSSPPHILVNNAAALQWGPLEELKREQFDELVRVNLWGIIVGSRKAGQHLANGGSIINFSSVTVHKPQPWSGLYAATKAAVESLTRTAAIELAPRDITVNALIVGLVATDMVSTVPLKSRQQIAAQTLVSPKVGRPEDIAGSVVFLASDDARWVTGQTLGVNGGYLMR